MPVNFTESIVVTKAILNAAEAIGLDASLLLKEAGVTETISNDPEARVPSWVQKNLLDAGVALSGNPAFGIEVGRHVLPDTANVLWYAVLNAATLREAVEMGMRYSRFFSDVISPELVETPGSASIVMRTAMEIPIWPSVGSECTLSVYAATIFRYFQDQLCLKEVRFQHAPLREIGYYEDFFHCPAHFSQTSNELVLDQKMLSRPGSFVDKHLMDMMVRLTDKVLSRLDTRDALLFSVRQSIRNRITRGSVGLDEVALEMGVTPRTLQRRLGERNTSFSVLYDTLRKEMATTYLREPQYALNEVAFLLGFTTLESFYQAFRRWYQTTPGDYRDKLRSA